MQDLIQNLLNEATGHGQELGIQVTAYYKGKLVVDTWSGYSDSTRSMEVNGNTLFPVFSTSKGIAATIIHLLVERGQIGYETRVVQVWPEFGINGKEEITLRHCLTHTAGLPYMPGDVGPAEVHQWDVMCRAIAHMEPSWPPGTRMEYHALTYGWLLGEVAQRVDGRPFSQVVQEEICQPLNLNTLFIGLPATGAGQSEPAIATLETRDYEMPEIDDSLPQAVPGWLWPLHEMMNQSEARHACQPASSGLMNARAIAKHYAALLPGGVDGVELLPPERVRIATVGQHLPDGTPLQRGLGYMLGGEDSVMGPQSAFGHGGYGGSLGFADLESGLAFGLTKNLFSPANTVQTIVQEVRKCIEQK